jgi:hypothetical protein
MTRVSAHLKPSPDREAIMSKLFKKLNLGDLAEILVVNAPASFEIELNQLPDVRIHRDPKGIKRTVFVLGFATTLAEVKRLAKMVVRKTEDDVIVWVAYPKGTSRNYTCEFNRDAGWSSMGDAGFEPVRQVAIDDDWSALRFRRVQFIKSMVRKESRRLTGPGNTSA